MIPFLDLPAQHRAIRAELDAAISEVIQSAQFILGPAVERFETAFARYCGTKEAIGVNSGTSALHLAFLSLGIGPGDEVVTAAHTFLATAAAIEYTGARPVLVDVDPERFTMDPARLENAITPRTRAIVPVHLYGQLADMDPIVEIAARRNIPIVEDAAQAHGATYKGRVAGGIGRIGCFSFYPGKNLGACGEAGAVVTNDPEFARKVRAMRDWGQVQRSVHEMPGYNYRMEGIQGAVLAVKLPHLPAWTQARQRVARKYDDLFSRSAIVERVRLPRRFSDGSHVYHQYVIKVQERERVRLELLKRDVQTGIHYPRPLHLQPILARLGYKAGDFPQAERVTGEIVSMPIYPELTDDQIATVVAATEESIAAVAS